MRRFLVFSALLVITTISTALLGIKPVNAARGPATLLDQTQYDGELRIKLGRVGQVFKPDDTGLIDGASIKIGTSGSNCMTTYLRLYEWTSSPTVNPSVGRGDLIAESSSRRVCSSTGHPTPVELTWDFVNDNEVVISNARYYYVEFDFDEKDQPAWATPSVNWLGHSDPTLINGEAWGEYQGVWGNPPNYSSVKDLYFRINAIPDGKISIEYPSNSEILSDRSAVFEVAYAEPHTDAFNSVKIRLLNFHTKELLQEETVILSPSQKTTGYHSINVPVGITEQGNYFEAHATLQDCSAGLCQDGATGTPQYFSVLDTPSQQDFIVFQPSLDGQIGNLKSERGIVGQVFKPENGGTVHTVTMRLGTGGNSCQTFHARIYEWFGDREGSPEAAQGLLLAESEPERICHNTASRGLIDFGWRFSSANQIPLSDRNYYFLEIDYDGRIPNPPGGTVPSTDWFGSANGSLIDGRAWITENGSWVSPPSYAEVIDLYLKIEGEIEQDLIPVVIVPGIMGSRLNRVSDGEEVWPNGREMLQSKTDEYLDGLKLDSSGNQIDGREMSPTRVIDEILSTVAYGDLIDSFSNQGYASGTTLFTVPYDWRLDVRDEVNRLDAAVQEAIANSSSGKVNIIAHSMGGVLVKEYLNKLPDTSFVDKLIVAGVPHLGAPKAFKALNFGDNMGFEVGSIDILNPERIKIISQNMPGVYGLLPSRRYIDVSGGYIRDFRNGVHTLSFNETEQFMSDAGRNSPLLDKADDFHQGTDDLQFSASNVHNIMGCNNNETIGEIRIYENGKFKIAPTNGDGTVPINSAINLSSGYENYFASYKDTKVNHVDLIRDEEIVGLISDIISSGAVDLPDGVSQSTSDCFDDSGNFFRNIFSSHSPVDLHVYDSQGRHLGPNADGDIELEIPDSDYQIIEGNNFAFVPGGDTYEIVLEATGTGKFDFEIEQYNGTDLVEKVTYLGVPLQSDETIASVGFSDPADDLTLELDSDGDGVADEQIQPNAVLDSSVAGDVTPPEVLFNMQSEVIVNAQVSADFLVMDDLSGIEIIEADLNGMPVNMGDMVAVSEVGEHTFTVRAVDKAGNPRVTEFRFNAVYNFGGFLPPLGKVRLYNMKQVLPVKFRLTDYGGSSVSTAEATLSAENTDTGEVLNIGMFRYDEKEEQYIYNLKLPVLGGGEWVLRVELGDGKVYEVAISIRG